MFAASFASSSIASFPLDPIGPATDVKVIVGLGFA